jgi:hypothetical protein
VLGAGDWPTPAQATRRLQGAKHQTPGSGARRRGTSKPVYLWYWGIPGRRRLGPARLERSAQWRLGAESRFRLLELYGAKVTSLPGSRAQLERLPRHTLPAYDANDGRLADDNDIVVARRNTTYLLDGLCA